MKKSIITALAISLLILGGSFATVQIKNAEAKGDTIPAGTLLASNTDLKIEPQINYSKNETVYILANAEGDSTKSFVGSTINTSEEIIPINLQITYFLDGAEISAADLLGQSGHVRIEFKYTSTKSYQNYLIPFVTLTGTILDGAKFHNVTLENGKIISADNGSITVVGYTLAGLNENLGTDSLPDVFAIEADVVDFEFGTTYAVADNNLLADIDTTKLTSINNLVSSINQMSSSFDQIISGAYQLKDGASQLAAGLNQVVTLHNQILTKANDAIAKVTAIAENLIEEYNIDEDIVAELTAPLQKYYNEAYTAITTYADGIKSLADGADQLSNGTDKLYSGLTTFKYQGLNKLVNFANQDLANFVYRLRKSVDAASSYRSYNDSSTDSTKFIFKISGTTSALQY